MEVQQRKRAGKEQKLDKKHEIQFNHSVRCMETRKDFMHLFSMGKGDLWNRQADNGQRTVSAYQKSEEPPTMVAIHFSKTSRETMTDKINRLILHDINSEDFS